MSKVLIPVADSVEDIETVTIIDVLRRAQMDVTVASIHDRKQVTAARGVRIEADCLLSDCAGKNWDLIALPGGMPGAEHLSNHAPLIELLKAQAGSGKLYAAVCASPAVVFARHGLLSNKHATCYPSMQEQLPDSRRAAEAVVIDGNCITSQGPATAMAFSLALVEALAGKDLRDKLAGALLCSGY